MTVPAATVTYALGPTFYGERADVVIIDDPMTEAQQTTALMAHEYVRVGLSYQEARGTFGTISTAAEYAVNTVEAAHKSSLLLKEWLSPEQLEQYEMTGKFSVTGSHSNAKYWIGDGSKSHNVVRIDPKRKIGTERLCFVPQGASAPGDVMLAQKIMLETDEPQALKIANRYRVTIDGRW